VKRLTKLRNDRGWTRAALAAEADVHPSDLGKWESGRSTPYPGQLERLAKALDVKRPKRLLDEVEA